MKMIIWLLLPVLFSCASRSPSSEETPSWIEGIKSGKESLKVKNGEKVFYRRILPLKENSTQKTCDEVLGLVTMDLQNEFSLNIKIPYTLDYLHYDTRFEVCAVTISISSSISNRMIEIKKIKENFNQTQAELEKEWKRAISERDEVQKKNQELNNFIIKNKALLDRYNENVSALDRARSALIDRTQRSIASAYRGLSINEFENLMKENVAIDFSFDSPCYKGSNITNVSYHGGTHVCWTSRSRGTATVRSWCDSTTGRCFYRDP